LATQLIRKIYNPASDLNIKLGGEEIYLKLQCEECDNISLININDAKMRDSYIHCKHCDTYYKLLFSLSENYSISDQKRTLRLETSVERIDKKELMYRLIIKDIEDGYVILEEE